MRLSTMGLLVAVVVSSSGCSRTFEREAVQPNPLLHPSETLRTSEKVTIVTGDMDLAAPNQNDKDLDAQQSENSGNATVAHPHRWPLINQAFFTMVSRDRLRFHVQIDHKWEDYADLKQWDVELTDDQGRHWDPESVEHVRRRVITTMWDQEQRSQICDANGRMPTGDCINTIGFANDGWRNRQPLGSLSVFRGNGDFVFYQRDLFTAKVRWMKLTVSRRGQAFEFVWRFQDDVAAAETPSPTE
ncbi:MAG TPA: hypothetical protein VFQ65_06770 [Kofleriaceae bacterium]|nr:hypothetical protein [Kofleriaceae bacterium]